MTIHRPRRLSRQRWKTACIALLWLPTLASPALAQSPPTGTLLVGIRRTIREPHDAELIDLRGGPRRALPLGRTNRARSAGSDTWSASAASAHTLLRVDDAGDADFLDRESLRPLGSFSLKSLPGTHDPTFLGRPRLSPDGQYVLAYWLRDARRDEPELAVFDREGRVLQEVSPADARNRSLTQAIGWAPRKGRYVHLGRDGIAVCQLGTPRCLVAPLHLPAGVGVGNVQLDVSPDGLHLALVLGQQWRTRSGSLASHSVLFTSNLDGSNLRALTMPSAALQASGTDYAPVNPRWSPDGRWIAFTPHGANPLAAAYFHDSCSETRVVPAGGEVQVLGAETAQGALLKSGGAPISGCSFLEWLD